MDCGLTLIEMSDVAELLRFAPEPRAAKSARQGIMNLSVTTVDFLVVLGLLVSHRLCDMARLPVWRRSPSSPGSRPPFACIYFGPEILPLAQGMIGSPWLAALAAYAVVFLAVLIPLSFMSHRFSQTVKGSPIGPFDRALGRHSASCAGW